MLNATLLALLAAGQSKVPTVAFEDLRPVLKKHCLNCHNGERPRGGLDMTTKAAILAGSDSGVAIAPGKPKDSLLYRMVAHIEAPHMPPNSARIPESELAMIESWIAAGLPERKDLAKTSPSMNPVPSVSPPATETAAKTATAVAPRRNPAVVSLALLTDGNIARPLSGAFAIGDSKPIDFGEPEIRVLRTSGDWLLAAGGEGGKTGKASLYKGSPPRMVREIAEEFDTIMAADIHAPGGRVALAGTSRIVKVHKISDGKAIYSIKDHIDWILEARFSPDGLLLATGDRSGTTLLTEAETGAKVHALRSGGAAVLSIAWQPDGNALVTAGADGYLRLWDAHHGGEIGSWMAHEGGALAVAAMPGNRWVSVGRDRKAVVWSAKGEVSALLQSLPDTPLSIVTEAGGTVAIGLAGGEIARADFRAVSLPEIVAKAPGGAPETAASNGDARLLLLKSLEDSAERLKADAAAHPQRKELAESYLSLCRAILFLKAEVIKDQATGGRP